MGNLLESSLLRCFPACLGKSDNILGCGVLDESVLWQKPVSLKARTATILIKMHRRTTGRAHLMLHGCELLIVKPICIQRGLFSAPFGKVPILTGDAPLRVKSAVAPARLAIPSGGKRRDRLPLELPGRPSRSHHMGRLGELAYVLCRIVDNLGDTLSRLRRLPSAYILEADRGLEDNPLLYCDYFL
jgi:hypothetical protein